MFYMELSNADLYVNEETDFLCGIEELVSEGVYVERKIANCLLVGPNGSGKSL
jgi:ABC-type Mn2+/Zn2+ transport system ATPase subunit